MEMSKTYNPKEFEDRIYKNWEEKGYFHADENSEKEPYTIVMPPPNVTGQLHMGHAMNNTIQDIIIRQKRMQGFNALWVPGTDHASIATEAKIVAQMNEEGIKKEDIGRDGFLTRAWEWKNQYGGKIVQQLKKLGCSCDWSRERFTMDEGLSQAVEEEFIRLYNEGLIYRSERIVNWCPNCKTSISDEEIDYAEKDGHFYHLRYELEDKSGYLELATTRPETMLGDTAVAVNPTDERYTGLVGKNLILPLVGKIIPIIADDYVMKDFGTGVVKITPAHDPNDFEVGKRHNLEVIKVIGKDGCMNENSLQYKGMDRYIAREAVLEDLKKGGYLVKIENHKHNVGTCYRCKTVIEPDISSQWYVKMETIVKPAIEAVKNKEIRFVPERFEKVYFNWLENTQDWCISRQLWWGHRIPAYYCNDCNNIMVSKEKTEKCDKCNSNNISQDEDTFDTWFSSALWPFSTLGWPNNTKEMETFFPTSTLVTAYDIITFWVSKMIFSSLKFTGKIPFKDVVIHGLVRDEQGKKMSKSLGNGIDPLEIIDKYGTDAFRFSLIQNTSAGNDTRFSSDKLESARNFANKIHNAAKFVLINTQDLDIEQATLKELQIEDKWIVTKLNKLVNEVTNNMDNYDLGIALSKIYDFIWSDFCDMYIEMVKGRLYNKQDTTSSQQAMWTLNHVFLNSMKLLHPYMPFITEEIYSKLKQNDESIMISSWPASYANSISLEDETIVDNTIEIVREIRNMRNNSKIPNSKKLDIMLVTNTEVRSITKASHIILSLANANEIKIVENKDDIYENSISSVLANTEIYINMDSVIDKDKEIERLLLERDKLEKEVIRSNNMLSNKGFVAKAPDSLILNEKDKLSKYVDMLENIKQRLNELG